jgi:hypothetical protein
VSVATTYEPPFGIIEQRGLEYMKLVRLDPLHRHLYTYLLVRADKGTGELRDRIDTLADWSGMSARKVQEGLAMLGKYGLIRRSKRQDPGGGRGHAWVWKTTVMPHASWSPEPLQRIIATFVAYVCTFYPPTEERAHGASSPTKNTRGMAEERAQVERRARTATRDNPDTYPEVHPESHALRSDDAAALTNVVVRLAKSWVAGRHAGSLERFTDSVAVRWLREAAMRALEAGCDETDLSAALRQHVTEEFADPRQFDRWALAARDDRLLETAKRRRAEERLCREREHDERVLAERAEPGYAGRAAAIIAETRAILSMSRRPHGADSTEPNESRSLKGLRGSRLRRPNTA